MTEKEDLDKVQHLFEQYTIFINEYCSLPKSKDKEELIDFKYPVKVDNVRVIKKPYMLNKSNHSYYKYTLSIWVQTGTSVSKYGKMTLDNLSEHYFLLDEAIKPNYKYHFIRDVVRDIILHDDPVTNEIVYQLIKDAYESEHKSGKHNAN